MPSQRSYSDGGAPEGISTLFKKNHYRVVVMGAAEVGKSCIVSQILYDTFLPNYKATVEEMHRGEYDVCGQTLTLDFLDTAGMYEFPAMRKLSIATADAFVLVYSIDSLKSFEEVSQIRQQIIEERTPKKASSSKGETDEDVEDHQLPPIVIVGNKSDVEPGKRAILRETAETTANIDWDHGYTEVSAKDNYNISEIYRELLAQINVELLYAAKPSTAMKQKKKRKRDSCAVS